MNTKENADNLSVLEQLDVLRDECEKENYDSFFIISAKSKGGRIVKSVQSVVGQVGPLDWVAALELGKSFLIDELKSELEQVPITDLIPEETYSGECSDAPKTEEEAR